MSKKDKKLLNNRSFGDSSSSDTETEKINSRPKSGNKTTYENSFKLKLTTSDEEDTPRSKDDGRKSRTDQVKFTQKNNNKYSDDDDDDLTVVSNSNTKKHDNRSRTPSTERFEIKATKKIDSEKLNNSKKINHFSRPKSREQSSSSDESLSFENHKNKNSNQNSKSKNRSRSSSPSFSENTNKLKVKAEKSNSVSSSKTNNSVKSSKINKKSDSDSDSVAKNYNKFKNKNKNSDESSDSFDRPKNTKKEKKKRPILKTSSSDSKSSSSSSSSSSESRSRSNSRSTSRTRSRSRSQSSSELSSRRKRTEKSDDDEEEHSSYASSVPMKINIERKPPIDKSSLTKRHSNRSPSLEKPRYDSDTDSKMNGKSSKQKNLNETFELDSQNSSNEMTDVSPLPSPRKSKNKEKSKKLDKDKEKDTDKLDNTIFYNALNNDFNKKMDTVLKGLNGKLTSTRPSSVNFDNTNIRNTSSNFNNDLNTCIDYSQTAYGTKLMRLDAENRKLYEKLLKVNQKEKKTEPERPIRITSSALNRQREQQRIEKENQHILKRLLDVKSSKYLRKDDQLKDYERNFGYTSLNHSRLANSSTTSMSTKRSAKSTANNSRVSSAKSATRSQFSLANLDPSELLKRTASLSRQRPDWNDRW